MKFLFNEVPNFCVKLDDIVLRYGSIIKSSFPGTLFWEQKVFLQKILKISL